MKTKIEKEVTLCDNCKRDCYGYQCLNCGAEYCYGCQESRGESFTHAVNFSGSGDGYYCNPCMTKLAKEAKDKKFLAYYAIKLLKKESHDFYEAFKIKAKKAEEYLKSL